MNEKISYSSRKAQSFSKATSCDTANDLAFGWGTRKVVVAEKACNLWWKYRNFHKYHTCSQRFLKNAWFEKNGLLLQRHYKKMKDLEIPTVAPKSL